MQFSKSQKGDLDDIKAIYQESELIHIDDFLGHIDNVKNYVRNHDLTLLSKNFKISFLDKQFKTIKILKAYALNSFP